MRRAFVEVAGRLVHYRCGGQGAPVVMLHPAPLSSAQVLPVARALTTHFSVFALDTPGCGLSDPLPGPDTQSLEPYLDPRAGTLDALGIRRCCLYGAAAGAQIALEFARRYPDRVSLLVLESAGHMSEAETSALLPDYFPSVEPRPDGAHLLAYWHMVRELNHFFPWSVTRLSHRVERDLPEPAQLQALLLDYLRAGPSYPRAYRPALRNERVERYRGLEVPALLTRWPGSLMLRTVDALLEQGLPPGVELLPLGPTLGDRASGIRDALLRRGLDDPPPVERNRPRGTGLHRSLIDGPGGASQQLLARMCLDGSARPLAVVHEAGGSTALHEAFIAAAAAERPVVAIDLPGHGESDGPQDTGTDAIPAAVGSIAHVLGHLGIDECDVIGLQTGGLIATELALAFPGAVRRVMHVGPWLLDSEEREEFSYRYVPSLTPHTYGTHLIAAWQMLRDMQLYWPWFKRTRESIRWCEPDLDPTRLHARFVELMKAGEHYADLMTDACRYPLEQRLGGLRAPAAFAATADDPLEARCVPAARLAPDSQVVILPDDPALWPQELWDGDAP